MILFDQLSAGDDPALWKQVLNELAVDASTLDTCVDLVFEVGACSHWLRPHQTRWKAAGGFAAPLGYGDIPNFDWSILLRLDLTTGQWMQQ